MKPLQRTRPARANHEYVKKINTSIVLDCIREHGPVSRAEIARRTELYPATVSSLVSELLAQDLIVETGVGASTGGRQPVLLELNAREHRIVGVAIGSHALEVGVVDLRGTIVERTEVELDDRGPQAVVRRTKALIAEMIEEGRVEVRRILGVGVSVPGPVDTADGTVVATLGLPGWGRYSLGEELKGDGPLNYHVDNAIIAALAAERWFGSVSDGEYALYLAFDWTVAGGLLVEGRAYRGGRHAGGEFGHMVVDADGKQCVCGNFGCLNTLASGEAVAAKWSGSGEDADRRTLERLLDAADAGDDLATSLLDEAGRYAGIALAGLINALAPDKVVVGGILPRRSATFYRRLHETARRRAWSAVAQSLDIRRSSLGADSALLGSAALVLDRIFKVPSV